VSREGVRIIEAVLRTKKENSATLPFRIESDLIKDLQNQPDFVSILDSVTRNARINAFSFSMSNVQGKRLNKGVESV
jgi:hypothetical protein